MLGDRRTRFCAFLYCTHGFLSLIFLRSACSYMLFHSSTYSSFTCQVPEHHKHHQTDCLPLPIHRICTNDTLCFTHSFSNHSSSWCRDLSFGCPRLSEMAPKREASIKKSPSLVTQPRLGPPYPCLPVAPAAPKQAPEKKPRMLRPSDSPFDPSTLEVS